MSASACFGLSTRLERSPLRLTARRVGVPDELGRRFLSEREPYRFAEHNDTRLHVVAQGDALEVLAAKCVANAGLTGGFMALPDSRGSQCHRTCAAPPQMASRPSDHRPRPRSGRSSACAGAPAPAGCPALRFGWHACSAADRPERHEQQVRSRGTELLQGLLLHPLFLRRGWRSKEVVKATDPAHDDKHAPWPDGKRARHLKES